MSKIFILIISVLTLYGVEFPIGKAKIKTFKKEILITSQIVSLPTTKENVTSFLEGKIKKYFIKINQNIKKNQKIALIESIELLNLTSNFLSLKKELKIFEKNYNVFKKLYKKGLISLTEFNSLTIKREKLISNLNRLNSILKLLNIDSNNLKKPKKSFIIYAKHNGIIDNILLPLNSKIDKNRPIVTIITKNRLFLKSFLPIKYINFVKKNSKIVSDYFDKKIVTYVSTISPTIDKKTQRVVLLSPLYEKDLYINTFLTSKIYLNKNTKYVAIKKSALTFINGNWIVFIPKEEKHSDDKDDDHEIDYDIKIVKIVAEDGNWIGVEGLKENEKYIEKNSYYLKSLILKSSLGEHGH